MKWPLMFRSTHERLLREARYAEHLKSLDFSQFMFDEYKKQMRESNRLRKAIERIHRRMKARKAWGAGYTITEAGRADVRSREMVEEGK